MVIRKYADRSGWERIVRKQFKVMPKKTVGFSGVMTLYEMIEVKEPLYRQYDGEQVCVAGDGFKWLQHFPEHAPFTLTSMYDARDHVVQRRIEICKRHGVTENSVPWYDDLYLKIVITPSGAAHLVDRDELEGAMLDGTLGMADYELALSTAHHILDEYRTGSFDLLLIADMHLQQIYEY